METRGELSVASSNSTAPVPDFERWSFGRETYAQFLADVGAVHNALEEALKAAAEALEHTANESLQGHSVGTPPKEALANVEREMARVLVAIGEATGEHPS